MPSEEPTKEHLSSRKLLAPVFVGLKIHDRRMGPQDLKNVGRASSQDRAVDGTGPENASLGQSDPTVTLLTKEQIGRLKLLPERSPIPPGQDPPEGGVGGDPVPIGSEPLANLFLSSQNKSI